MPDLDNLTSEEAEIYSILSCNGFFDAKSKLNAIEDNEILESCGIKKCKELGSLRSKLLSEYTNFQRLVHDYEI